LVATACRTAQGRAQRAAHHDRRPGLWHSRHVRRRHPDAGAGPDREGGAALHRIQFRGALLADTGYDAIIGPENATIGEILKENGYATSWFGKNHNTPGPQYSIAGPYDQWPSGMGFDYFYGFMGGETDQWEPYLFRDHTQIFPWVGKRGYNLTTDMADEAINYMRHLKAAAPDKPFFPNLRVLLQNEAPAVAFAGGGDWEAPPF